jgi:hypothetical protein
MFFIKYFHVKYMKNFNLRFDRFVFCITIMVFFASTIWISSVSALPQQQTSVSVRITYPMKDQQLSVGKNLTLSGISSYNATSNCGVFVIVDGIRPYQKTTPTGQGGGDDYSKWKYTLTSTYAGTIREGVNRITAKLLCQANPANLTKFYSINVTGMNGIVPKQYPAITRNNTAAVPISSNSLSYLFHPTPLINHLSVSTDSNSPASSDSSVSSGRHHHSNYGISGPGFSIGGGPDGGISGPGFSIGGGPDGGISGPGFSIGGGPDGGITFGGF